MLAMDYATARLRTQDEARSKALARDPRVYRPDPDEVGPVACVVCEGEVERGLVCAGCRAKGWAAGECRACGERITRRDRMTKGPTQGMCKRCRDGMRPASDLLDLSTRGRR